MGLGWTELLIILFILLILFGPSRLGDLGSSLGKGIKGFKRAMKEPDELDVTPPKETPHIQSENNPSGKEEAK